MGTYRSVLRPLLFRLPPERAHHLSLTALRWPLPWARMGGAVDDDALAIGWLGMRLRNPVGLAAGFDKNCEVLPALGRLGFGYLVGGSVTAAPRAGNAQPRIARLPAEESMINAMGLPNRGADAIAAGLTGLRPTAPTLISVTGAEPDEVVGAAEQVAPHAAAIELNVSCPNVRWGRDVTVEAMLSRALPRLRALGMPVLVKLPPYAAEREREAVLTLARIARDEGAGGITASNTRPLESDRVAVGRGGLSGRAVFADTLRIVRDLYAATGGEVTINACGGIVGAEDALACIRAGASTVQVYTAFIYRGPGLVGEITRGLRDALGDAPGALPAQIGAQA
jgi:dihydroorotate dehydrogenase